MASPYHFKVDDKKTRLKININHLKPGIYKFLIQKESENLFFDEIEADICILSNFQKGIIKGRTEEDTSPMEKVLSEILKTRFLKAKVTSKRLLKLQNDIKNLSVQMPEDMNMLSYAYILHNRFLQKGWINELFQKFLIRCLIYFLIIKMKHFVMF